MQRRMGEKASLAKLRAFLNSHFPALPQTRWKRERGLQHDWLPGAISVDLCVYLCPESTTWAHNTALSLRNSLLQFYRFYPDQLYNTRYTNSCKMKATARLLVYVLTMSIGGAVIGIDLGEFGNMTCWVLELTPCRIDRDHLGTTSFQHVHVSSRNEAQE